MEGKRKIYFWAVDYQRDEDRALKIVCFEFESLQYFEINPPPFQGH